MLHQVGVGALGPVFRTYEPTRDRLVAVKVFRLDVTPEQAQSLADELSRAAEAGLFHPSVVEPIAAGVEGTVAYRAEEYVAAETLDVALRHYAPAPIDKVLPLITQLAGAIDFARASGVGHGALHPRDIFVTPDEARATGFGVVEALERVGLRAPVRRPYSAPERVAGSAWGTPADVFSLAAIAYELLTGRRPAGTGSQIGAVSGSSAGHHPGALHAVFVRAMDEDPEGRYDTALGFASALDAAARGEAAQAAGFSAGVAGLATLTAPEDPDDSAEDLPPLEDVDARAEPVQAELQEADFRADEPEFDDVLAEQAEDEAHIALLSDEAAHAQQDAGEGLLFDDEAVEDLALDEPTRAETERFADEFSLAASGLRTDADTRDEGFEDEAEAIDETEPVHEDDDRHRVAAGAIPIERYEGEHDSSYPSSRGGAPVVYDRRPAVLPTAVAVVLALLVGFAAGHSVGKRSSAPAASDSAATGAAATEPAQPYSEGTLTPPEAVQPTADPRAAGEPPIPADAAPPAAARPPVPAAGRLLVRSTPSRASVTVDGDWRGRTPLTIDKVPFGSHDIRVVLSGYAVASEEVTLSSGTPSRTLSFRLRRTAPAARPPATPPRSQTATPRVFTGSIYVDSRPRGARVLLDNKPVGTTPLRIPGVSIGSHIIRLQLPDHRDWTTAARVVSGQEARVTGSLERIR